MRVRQALRRKKEVEALLRMVKNSGDGEEKSSVALVTSAELMAEVADTVQRRTAADKLDPDSVRRCTVSVTRDMDVQVSVLLCTVTFYANLAHSLTRSP